MNRHISLTLGAAAGAILASAALPVAIAFADTGSAADAAAAVYPDAPGTDAVTLGGYTFDPYLYGSSTITNPGVEGFNPVSEGTGTPNYFETGAPTDTGQGFLVYSPASGSTAATELGTVNTTESVTNYDGITNTGFTVVSDSPVTGGSAADLPAVGSMYDVTNFGSGYENIYTDIPGASGAAPTVTDELVTPFGDDNLSSLVSAFDLSSLYPGAAFGLTEPAAGAAAAAPSATGADAFTLGNYTFDPTLTDSITPTAEGFNPLTAGVGTPNFFETGDGSQNFEVFSTASGSTTPTLDGVAVTSENVTSIGNITNTGFTITSEGIANGQGSFADMPALNSVYDVTNFGSGFENVYADVPGAAGAAGTVTDSFITPFGDYNLSDLVSAFDLSALDPGSAFGLSADAAGAAADAAGSIDPLSFLGL
jgi:hypothetical protein